jgi:hypothetical protein
MGANPNSLRLVLKAGFGLEPGAIGLPLGGLHRWEDLF